MTPCGMRSLSYLKYGANPAFAFGRTASRIEGFATSIRAMEMTRMREFFRSNWASIRTGLLYGFLFYLLYWLGVGIGMAGEWWGNFALGH